MYARTSPHYTGMPLDEAIDRITKDFEKRIAPEGLKTAGQFFLAICLGETQIGYFHFGEFPKGAKSVYGWNFHIFDEYQRRGWGRASMKLANEFFKKLGYQKVALNVIATNTVAIELYKKFGFKVAQVNMEAEIL
jgi:ribosomal protein S18 acetylase RimI-like enzyme